MPSCVLQVFEDKCNCPVLVYRCGSCEIDRTETGWVGMRGVPPFLIAGCIKEISSLGYRLCLHSMGPRIRSLHFGWGSKPYFDENHEQCCSSLLFKLGPRRKTENIPRTCLTWCFGVCTWNFEGRCPSKFRRPLLLILHDVRVQISVFIVGTKKKSKCIMMLDRFKHFCKFLNIQKPWISPDYQHSSDVYSVDRKWKKKYLFAP